MAIFYVPGDKYLRSEENKARRMSGLLFTALLVLVGFIIFITSSGLPDWILFLCILLILPVIYSCFRYFRLGWLRGRNFRRGRFGEYRVVAELKSLSDDWHVFYDLVLPGEKGNIDLAVIGPGGLFTIDVKSHRGRIEYSNGWLLRNSRPLEKDFLRQARHESRQLGNFFNHAGFRLPLPVPLIIFPSDDSRVLIGARPVDGVFVYHVSGLIKLMNNRNSAIGLSASQCSAAADILKRAFPKMKIISAVN